MVAEGRVLCEGMDVQLAQLSTFLIFSQAQIIRSLVQKPDNLLLKTALLKLLNEDDLVVVLNLSLQLCNLLFVFVISSDERCSFVNLAFDLAWHSLLVAEEVLVGGAWLSVNIVLIELFSCVLVLSCLGNLLHPLECFCFDFLQFVVEFSLDLLLVQLQLLDFKSFLFKLLLLFPL
jgi:hypothetical protein